MLLTLEGLDGSGKSSCVEMLKDSTATPPDTTFTREPTGSWYGDAVRRSIRDDDADPLAELFLYTADHAEHLSSVIEPAIERDEVIISDRYSDSRYAYQGATLSGVVPDPVSFVQRIHQPWTRPPDATLYLDIDPETAAERSGATNKFETAEYLATVREHYERLIDDAPERFVRIDASRPKPAVEETVREVVETLL
jgi:dTMP kinase